MEEKLEIHCENDFSESDIDEVQKEENEDNYKIEIIKRGKIQPHLRLHPILGTDGLLVKSTNSSITTITYKDGSMEELCGAVENFLKNENIMMPIVLLSAGNCDLSTKYFPISTLQREKYGSMVRKMVQNIMIPLNKLKTVVEERDGRIIVASLIPCPKFQSYEKSKLSEKIQCVFSTAYCTINDEFDEFNEANLLPTPPLKKYMEVSGKRKIYYKDRRQKKIRVGKYKADMVCPETEISKKMTKALESIILDKDCHNKIKSAIMAVDQESHTAPN